MMSSDFSRREFLGSSAGTLGWLALHTSPILALAACAREDAAVGAPLANLTPAEGRAMRAFAAQIVPSGDGLPGAEEAGAVHFIDRAVAEWFEELRPVVGEATEILDGSAGRGAFADLGFEVQRDILVGFEDEGWFQGLRFLVILGVFANPEYGGNRGGAADQILGYRHQPVYQPPFGHYDAGYDAASEDPS